MGSKSFGHDQATEQHLHGSGPERGVTWSMSLGIRADTSRLKVRCSVPLSALHHSFPDQPDTHHVPSPCAWQSRRGTVVTANLKHFLRTFQVQNPMGCWEVQLGWAEASLLGQVLTCFPQFLSGQCHFPLGLVMR